MAETKTRRERIMEAEAEKASQFIGMRLGRDVKVFDPTKGERIRLKRGDLVPEHLQSKVTNPALFEDSPSLPEDEADEKGEKWKRLTIPALKNLATDFSIDLGSATKKKDIIKVLEEAEYHDGFGSDDAE